MPYAVGEMRVLPLSSRIDMIGAWTRQRTLPVRGSRFTALVESFGKARTSTNASVLEDSLLPFPKGAVFIANASGRPGRRRRRRSHPSLRFSCMPSDTLRVHTCFRRNRARNSAPARDQLSRLRVENRMRGLVNDGQHIVFGKQPGLVQNGPQWAAFGHGLAGQFAHTSVAKFWHERGCHGH